jgi:hypothetical protein
MSVEALAMATSGFVDPRADPKPTDPRPSARTTDDLGVLVELHRLCRGGLLYEVEKWIRDGRPLQAAKGVTAKGRRMLSALEIGLETENRSLIRLLLCNGYDSNLESSCPVSTAIRNRTWDLMELLLTWGADPMRVSPRAVCESYTTEIIERFYALGVDLTVDHVLGAMLAEHSSNKPLFGFAKRHREHDPKIQTDLNMALGHHAGRDGSEKGVLLCVWAGADPHTRAPSLRYPSDPDDEDGDHGSTAIEEACHAGNVRILEKLGPDPSRDDFDNLYPWAPNGLMIDLLARFTLPRKEAVSSVIRSQLFWLQDHPFINPRSADTVRQLFHVGVRWVTATPQEINDIRRSLLRMRDYTFVEVVKIFATGDNCAPTILEALARTPTMGARIKTVGFFPPSPEEPWRYDRQRPTRGREVLAKFGVVVSKTPRPLPPTVEVGPRRRAGREVRLDRKTLFGQVWNQPVEKVAKEWGLSGRGLAKVCQRARIPVPPRGYWAKVQHGMHARRPSLPELPPGEVDEIVIYVPNSTTAVASE